MCVKLIPDIPWIFGNFLGVPGTGRKVSFETVDAMRVVDGRITEHWGVANLYSVMQQLGVLAPLP
jgi:predicted ester cyclase